MRGERVGQPEHGGELGAVEARAEDPERHVRAGAGDREDRLAGLRVAEQRLQLEHVLRERAPRRDRWRSARRVTRSVPGARPSPRSIRPGWSASSVPNCSAITSGAWFGSMMPPAPTRIVAVPPATWAITTAVAALAIPLMLWCSATQ